MSNNELLSKINAEIERLKDENRKIKCPANERYCSGYDDAFYDLVPFLNTLESEKPMNQDGLEKEIQKYLESKGIGYGGWIDGWKDEDLREIARHFYDLGCTRTAEKYDEIEYNLQRAEEQPVGLVTIKPTLQAAPKPCIATFKEQGNSSEISNDLEEAATITLDEAESVADEYTGFLEKGLIENQPRPIGGKWFVEYARKRFIAGAKWGREQMMKGAIEGQIYGCDGSHWIETDIDENIKGKYGDKVRVIIVKE